MSSRVDLQKKSGWVWVKKKILGLSEVFFESGQKILTRIAMSRYRLLIKGEPCKPLCLLSFILVLIFQSSLNHPTTSTNLDEISTQIIGILNDSSYFFFSAGSYTFIQSY